MKRIDEEKVGRRDTIIIIIIIIGSSNSSSNTDGSFSLSSSKKKKKKMKYVAFPDDNLKRKTSKLFIESKLLFSAVTLSADL